MNIKDCKDLVIRARRTSRVRGGVNELSYLVNRLNHQIADDSGMVSDEEFQLPDKTELSPEAEALAKTLQEKIEYLESGNPL